MNRQGSSALLTVAAIAGGFVFVATVALLSGAGLSLSPLVFVAFAVAIGVAIYLYSGPRKGPEAEPAQPERSVDTPLGGVPSPTRESTGEAGSVVTEAAPDPIQWNRAEGPVPGDEPSDVATEAPSVEERDAPAAGDDDAELDVAGDEDGTAMRAATDEIVSAEEPDAAGPSATDDAERDVIGHPPGRLDAPRDGQADDLKQLRGVGPKLEEELNAMGIYHLDQIAGWTPEELAWVDVNLQGFKGRASRDDWVAQARELTDEDS
ncbi:hypothetical protein [Palleronia sp.]|uniref:hypothetical protein n=1 Tax=Palleronia sp. TaxID=1940284 RepID=UPI0035C7EFD1